MGKKWHGLENDEDEWCNIDLSLNPNMKHSNQNKS
jgi:hypothetical protein